MPVTVNVKSPTELEPVVTVSCEVTPARVGVRLAGLKLPDASNGNPEIVRDMVGMPLVEDPVTSFRVTV